MSNVKETSAETTATHLSKFIGDILKSNKLDAKYCAYMLEFVFGKKIHKQVDGFITFAENPKNKVEDYEIAATLVHDLSGALQREEFMIPRVSEY
jgi:hypothetical protein